MERILRLVLTGGFAVGIVLLLTAVALGASGRTSGPDSRLTAAESNTSHGCGAGAGLRPQHWPMDLFVDGVSGSDDSSCTRESQPCRTIQAAINRIPAVLEGDAVVHILPGEYDGGLLLMDRLCPRGSRITLQGESILTFAPGVTEGTVILGDGLAKTGLTISRACSVSLENLTFRGFLQSGLALINTPMVRIVSSLIDSNGGHGLLVEDSKAEISNSMITSNAGDGVACDASQLRIGNSVQAAWPGAGHFGAFRADTGRDDPARVPAYRSAFAQMPTGGVVIAGNAVDGLNSLGCEVIFGGWAIVTGNAYGLRTDHGGVIDLAMRPDIAVVGNSTFQLEARCHGMIEGYVNAAIGGGCESCYYGVCRPE